MSKGEHRLRLSVEQYHIDEYGVRSIIRSHNIDVPGVLNGAFRAATGLMDAVLEGIPDPPKEGE